MPDRPDARNRLSILPVLLSLAAIPALSGCSAGGDYPSLASRPAERLTDSVPVGTASAGPAAPAAASGAPSAELAARLDALLEKARSARRAFDEQRAGAERVIAAAGSAPAGSEAWARATQGLSGLESARSLTAQPLTELDRLDVEDRLQSARLGPEDKSAPRPDTAAIAQARDAISALVAEEDKVLTRLDSRSAR